MLLSVSAGSSPRRCEYRCTYTRTSSVRPICGRLLQAYVSSRGVVIAFLILLFQFSFAVHTHICIYIRTFAHRTRHLFDICLLSLPFLRHPFIFSLPSDSIIRMDVTSALTNASNPQHLFLPKCHVCYHPLSPRYININRFPRLSLGNKFLGHRLSETSSSRGLI